MSSRASDTYDTSATFDTPRARTRGAPTIRYESYDYPRFFFYLKGVVGVVGIGSPVVALSPGSDTLSRGVGGRAAARGLCRSRCRPVPDPRRARPGFGGGVGPLDVYARSSTPSTATYGLIVLRSSCEK